MFSSVFLCAIVAALRVGAQSVYSDPGTYGPAVEIVHLYNDQWPSGIAVAANGRMFSTYPPGFDPNNTMYSVAEIFSNNTEIPYPSAKINSPPGGSINLTSTPPSGASYQDYIIGAQAVYIDPADRLWILDTGRAASNKYGLVQATYGGPKLIGVNLNNNSIFTTIVFSSDTAPSVSLLNDLRIDLTPSLTATGQGIAYITDSSPEGRNAIIVVDLGTKEAWRHLNNIESTLAASNFVPNVLGHPVYNNYSGDMGISNIAIGADGIALSPDGATLYFCPLSSRQLYSVPTALLRSRSASSKVLAINAVRSLGDKGMSDGIESDSNGNVYVGDIENNAILKFDPNTGLKETFVRDPRFTWTDTMSIAADGYMYFTENQCSLLAGFHQGEDKRVRPWPLFRVKLPGNSTKITQ